MRRIEAGLSLRNNAAQVPIARAGGGPHIQPPMDSQTTLPPFNSSDLRGRKVLVVDDDRMNIRILGGILKAEGYVLSDAGSGEKALEVYEAIRPDLVLLDVMLPGIDGFEA